MKKRKEKYADQVITILSKLPGDDDTSSGGHVRQPISGLGYGRGYIVAIDSLTAV